MPIKRSKGTYFTRDGRWHRDAEIIAVNFTMPLPVELQQSQRIILDYGVSAIRTNKTGESNIFKGPGNLELYGNDLHSILLFRNSFKVVFPCFGGKLKIHFSIDTDWLYKFYQAWLMDTTIFVEQHVEDEFRDIVEKVVSKYFSVNRDQNSESNYIGEQIVNAVELVFSQRLHDFGLLLERVRLISQNGQEMKPACSSQVLQDPFRPCWIWFSDAKPEVVLIEKDLLYIGGGENPDLLIPYLKRYALWEDERTQAFMLPMNTGMRDVLPIMKIECLSNERFVLYFPWPSMGMSVSQVFNCRINNRTVIPRHPYALRGFERIDFIGQPLGNALFIPPVPYSRMNLSEQILSELEEYGLWASAGYGWMQFGRLDRALKAFECSIQGRISNHVRAKILLLIVDILTRQQNEDTQARQNIWKYQDEAHSILGTPSFRINITGKMTRVGEKTRLCVKGRNFSDKHDAYDVHINWRCDGVGADNVLDFGNIRAGERFGPKYMDVLPIVDGDFPVEIRVEFKTSENKIFEQLNSDHFNVIKRKPRINVENVGGVRFEGDIDSMPDIEIKQDAGFINIREIRSK
jgi:hypothetical protein